MRVNGIAVALACGLSLLSGAATASAITRSYSFDAVFSSGPIADISGSFTATFDPASTGGKLDAFTSNLPSSYLPASFGNDFGLLAIGNGCSATGCSGDMNTNTFVVGFLVDTSGAVFDFLQAADYYTKDVSAPYLADTVTVALTGVPLPPAAPLFGGGLLALGVVGYGLKRKTTAATV